MTPLYFGEPGEALFGCWHAPIGGPARSTGIVLCPPTGQEYILAHRTFRLLAARLARQGFHCLRFDWYGCGDSSGEDADGRLDRWRADAVAAIDLMRTRSGVRSVAAVGLRLGATLAALAAAGRGDVDCLVLWDPVVNGRGFVEAMGKQHRDRLRRFPVLVETPPAGRVVTEALGFPVGDDLRADLDRLDLSALSAAPAGRILLVDTRTGSAVEPIERRLTQLGAQVEVRSIDTPSIWIEDINKVLVPHAVLQAILAWLTRVAA